MYSSSSVPSSMKAMRHSSGCATLINISCFISDSLSRCSPRAARWVWLEKSGATDGSLGGGLVHVISPSRPGDLAETGAADQHPGCSCKTDCQSVLQQPGCYARLLIRPVPAPLCVIPLVSNA